MNFKVYCTYEDFAGIVNIYIFKIDINGNRHICTNIEKQEFDLIQEGHSIKNPTIKLPAWIAKDFLQAMANAIDKFGIRAEGKPVLENELTAVKYHLEDMRSLVFNNLKGEKK